MVKTDGRIKFSYNLTIGVPVSQDIILLNETKRLNSFAIYLKFIVIFLKWGLIYGPVSSISEQEL